MNTPAAPATPTPLTPLTQADENELSLLSTLFFVYAAFVGLLAVLFGGIAIVPALLIGSTTVPAQAQQGSWIIGATFMAVFGAIAVFMLAKTVLVVMAGRALARRTNYELCMVGACVSLMNIPLGTALGIFAIVVLQRPAVKARFSYPM
jgi:hypothetical protein